MLVPQFVCGVFRNGRSIRLVALLVLVVIGVAQHKEVYPSEYFR
jgi:hypothetical protein